VPDYDYEEMALFKNTLANVYLQLRRDDVYTRDTNLDKNTEKRVNTARKLLGQTMLSQNGREQYVKETLIPNKSETAAGKSDISGARDDGPVKGQYMPDCYVAPENGVDSNVKYDYYFDHYANLAAIPLYSIREFWIASCASGIFMSEFQPGGKHDYLDMVFLAQAIFGLRFAGKIASAAQKTWTVEKALKELNLNPGASIGDVKTAYRNIAKNMRPDINPNADRDVFTRATEAYDFLCARLKNPTTKNAAGATTAARRPRAAARRGN